MLGKRVGNKSSKELGKQALKHNSKGPGMNYARNVARN